MLLFHFSIIDLYFLVASGITQIFNPTVELVIAIGIPTKEVKAEMKTHPVILEPKRRSYSV